MRQSLIGSIHGNLTVLKIDEKKTYISNLNKKVFYLVCKCSCGNIESVLSNTLSRTNNKKTSCKKCKAKNLNKNHSMYRTWRGLRTRVKNQSAYINKNIQACEEWNDFKVFAKWCETQNIPKIFEIDRLDMFGDYSPSNCQFLTPDEHRVKTCLEEVNRKSRTNTGVKYITERKDGYYQVTIQNKYAGRGKTLEEAKEILLKLQ